jgi:DNA-binding beta-propeller fold protein YncE
MTFLAKFTAVAVALAAAPGGYHVLREFPIGGEGGWDYIAVDSTARRLYVSHATRVEVVDADTGRVAGGIPDTPGVHGIALAPKLNRGFISSGRANSVTIFDLKTLAATGKVAAGENPDAILYEPKSGRVFAFNGRSKTATAFDAATGKVAATVPLGGKPEFAAADGLGKVYVNIEDTSEIVELDAARLTVAKRYSLAPCEEPSGLAMDVKQRRLFSVCANKIMAVSDPDTGKVVATPAIGQGSDGAGFDAERGIAFSSNGEGTLTLVREVGGQWQAVATVKTAPGARTMTVDEKTHHVYLPTAQFGPAQAGARRPPILPGTFKVLVAGE